MENNLFIAKECWKHPTTEQRSFQWLSSLSNMNRVRIAPYFFHYYFPFLMKFIIRIQHAFAHFCSTSWMLSTFLFCLPFYASDVCFIVIVICSSPFNPRSRCVICSFNSLNFSNTMTGFITHRVVGATHSHTNRHKHLFVRARVLIRVLFISFVLWAFASFWFNLC